MAPPGLSWALAWAALAALQSDAPIPPSPFDREIVLELTANDAHLVDGRGPTQVVEYTAEFGGSLHLWTSSELDLFLRAEDATDPTRFVEDDDSGGGDTPYLRFTIEPGDRLAVFVAGVAEPTALTAEGSPLVLRLIAAPETATTREAAAAAGEAVDESARSRSEGDFEGARERLEAAALKLREVAGAEHSQRIADACWSMGFAAHDVRSTTARLEAWSRAYRHRERTLPEDHADRLNACSALAISIEAIGDLAGARALREAVLAAYERTLPEDHPDLARTRNNLALSLVAMGDLAGARALREAVLAARERTLPEDHPDLFGARLNLAASMSAMGDLADARALEEAVVASYERTLPEDHPDVILARGNLAVTRSAMGDLVGARALREAVVAAYERTLPEDHTALLRARGNLAAAMSAMGDVVGARVLEEAVLAGFERTLPEDHPLLLGARLNLAISMEDMGDLAGARALQESVLAGYERTLPDDHPDLLRVRANLAISMSEMGDLVGARALREAVLAGHERTLPEDHPELLRARGSLALSMHAMGDLAGSRALLEAVVAGYERTFPEDHPDLLLARSTLANSMSAMGDQVGARALREEALAGYERTFPEDHYERLAARDNLAASMVATGDLVGARALREEVLAGYERTFTDDHTYVLLARSNLALSLWQMGDLTGAHALLPPLFDGMRARVLASLTLSPREARQTVAGEGRRLEVVHNLSAAAGSNLQKGAFELAETMRLVAGEAARSLARFGADPELGPILAEAASVRRSLNDLIAGQGRGDREPESIAAELTRLSFERDRLERKAGQRLAERGVVTRPVELEALAGALAAQDSTAAAVGYRRLPHWHESEATGRIERVADHLLAHVLSADGTLTRVDLGPASELEELATAWRASMGASLHSRGFSSAKSANGLEVPAGSSLRERLLDPVLEAAGGDVTRLHVCADDLVFLVPLDALPLDEGGTERVGDRVSIVGEVSFARLLSRQSPLEADPGLLALGGVDYEARGAVPEGLVAAAAPVAGPDATETMRGTRSARPGSFPDIPESGHEVETIAKLFREALEVEPALLTGKGTTKAALFAAAAGRSHVHLATHGWFAPHSVKSTEDAQPVAAGRALMSAEERFTGFAPMTLCGLALAGANGGPDSLRRVAGILTAEELCSLDLSSCELAVLSACETNVGIRRAGQGIQSLQAALYAAGARTSITSLWKVDDAATRRLMEVFYSNLWLERMPKSEALWAAKKALREEGHSPREWAGWVMTGDPD